MNASTDLPRVVLITGAGSGFGALTARALAAAGHRVLASMRDPQGRHREVAAALARDTESLAGSVRALELDVTSDSSVERAVGDALELEGRIDVVVNNAGLGMSGFAEAFTADEMRSLFEVNLFGVQRVNRSVLPSMRANGSGLLIHVSSTFGRHVVPFVAPYTATKWALEALAESYRHELAGSGVDVVIVEPGAFDTGHAGRIAVPEDERRAEDYGSRAEVPPRMWGSFVARMQEVAPNPELVGAAMVEIVESAAGKRPLRVVIDPVTGGGPTGQLNAAAEEAQDAFYRAIGVRDVLSED